MSVSKLRKTSLHSPVVYFQPQLFPNRQKTKENGKTLFNKIQRVLWSAKIVSYNRATSRLYSLLANATNWSSLFSKVLVIKDYEMRSIPKQGKVLTSPAPGTNDQSTKNINPGPLFDDVIRSCKICGDAEYVCRSVICLRFRHNLQ